MIYLNPKHKEEKRTKKFIVINPQKTLKKKSIIEIPNRPAVQIKLRKLNEVNKHIDNAVQLMLCSNATPIRCYGGIGYGCSFCSRQFPEPHELKQHTIDTHDEKALSTFMRGKSMVTYVVKLDITSLTCRLCNAKIEELDDLIDHVIKDHGKHYDKDIKSHIMPFRFEKNQEKIKCVMCNNEFNNFKVLFEHMNVHFNNHVCEICGGGFVNRRTLLTHGYRHLTGSFQCSFCSKVYDTKVKQREHERAVHKCMNKRNKCGYCGEKFTDYTKKKNHEVSVHGARPVVLKCDVCEKIFDNQRALTSHTKHAHKRDRMLPSEGKV